MNKPSLETNLKLLAEYQKVFDELEKLGIKAPSNYTLKSWMGRPFETGTNIQLKRP